MFKSSVSAKFVALNIRKISERNSWKDTITCIGARTPSKNCKYNVFLWSVYANDFFYFLIICAQQWQTSWWNTYTHSWCHVFNFIFSFHWLYGYSLISLHLPLFLEINTVQYFQDPNYCSSSSILMNFFVIRNFRYFRFFRHWRFMNAFENFSKRIELCFARSGDYFEWISCNTCLI